MMITTEGNRVIPAAYQQKTDGPGLHESDIDSEDELSTRSAHSVHSTMSHSRQIGARTRPTRSGQQPMPPVKAVSRKSSVNKTIKSFADDRTSAEAFKDSLVRSAKKHAKESKKKTKTRGGGGGGGDDETEESSYADTIDASTHSTRSAATATVATTTKNSGHPKKKSHSTISPATSQRKIVKPKVWRSPSMTTPRTISSSSSGLRSSSRELALPAPAPAPISLVSPKTPGGSKKKLKKLRGKPKKKDPESKSSVGGEWNNDDSLYFEGSVQLNGSGEFEGSYALPGTLTQVPKRPMTLGAHLGHSSANAVDWDDSSDALESQMNMSAHSLDAAFSKKTSRKLSSSASVADDPSGGKQRPNRPRRTQSVSYGKSPHQSKKKKRAEPDGEIAGNMPVVETAEMPDTDEDSYVPRQGTFPMRTMSSTSSSSPKNPLAAGPTPKRRGSLGGLANFLAPTRSFSKSRAEHGGDYDDDDRSTHSSSALRKLAAPLDFISNSARSMRRSIIVDDTDDDDRSVQSNRSKKSSRLDFLNSIRGARDDDKDDDNNSVHSTKSLKSRKLSFLVSPARSFKRSVSRGDKGDKGIKPFLSPDQPKKRLSLANTGDLWFNSMEHSAHRSHDSLNNDLGSRLRQGQKDKSMDLSTRSEMRGTGRKGNKDKTMDLSMRSERKAPKKFPRRLSAGPTTNSLADSLAAFEKETSQPSKGKKGKDRTMDLSTRSERNFKPKSGWEKKPSSSRRRRSLEPTSKSLSASLEALRNEFSSLDEDGEQPPKGHSSKSPFAASDSSLGQKLTMVTSSKGDDDDGDSIMAVRSVATNRNFASTGQLPDMDEESVKAPKKGGNHRNSASVGALPLPLDRYASKFPQPNDDDSLLAVQGSVHDKKPPSRKSSIDKTTQSPITVTRMRLSSANLGLQANDARPESAPDSNATKKSRHKGKAPNGSSRGKKVGPMDPPALPKPKIPGGEKLVSPLKRRSKREIRKQRMMQARQRLSFSLGKEVPSQPLGGDLDEEKEKTTDDGLRRTSSVVSESKGRTWGRGIKLGGDLTDDEETDEAKKVTEKTQPPARRIERSRTPNRSLSPKASTPTPHDEDRRKAIREAMESATSSFSKRRGGDDDNNDDNESVDANAPALPPAPNLSPTPSPSASRLSTKNMSDSIHSRRRMQKDRSSKSLGSSRSVGSNGSRVREQRDRSDRSLGSRGSNGSKRELFNRDRSDKSLGSIGAMGNRREQLLRRQKSDKSVGSTGSVKSAGVLETDRGGRSFPSRSQHSGDSLVAGKETSFHTKSSSTGSVCSTKGPKNRKIVKKVKKNKSSGKSTVTDDSQSIVSNSKNEKAPVSIIPKVISPKRDRRANSNFNKPPPGQDTSPSSMRQKRKNVKSQRNRKRRAARQELVADIHNKLEQRSPHTHTTEISGKAVPDAHMNDHDDDVDVGEELIMMEDAGVSPKDRNSKEKSSGRGRSKLKSSSSEAIGNSSDASMDVFGVFDKLKEAEDRESSRKAGKKDPHSLAGGSEDSEQAAGEPQKEKADEGKRRRFQRRGSTGNFSARPSREERQGLRRTNSTGRLQDQSKSAAPRADLTGFLLHLTVLNDLRELIDMPYSKSVGTQKRTRFQKMFQAKCCLLNYPDEMKNKSSTVRQEFRDKFDIEEDDLDFVVEHIELCQEESSPVRWDLIATMISPESPDDDDASKKHGSFYGNMSIVGGSEFGGSFGSDHHWANNDSSYFSTAERSQHGNSEEEAMTRREEYQEVLLDLYEAEESTMSGLSFEIADSRRDILLNLLQATDEEDAHLTTLSLDDVAEIVHHVRICNETDTEIQWDMVGDIVFPLGRGIEKLPPKNSNKNSSSASSTSQGNNNSSDSYGLINDLGDHDQANESFRKYFELSQPELDTVLGHINMCRETGATVRWDLIGEVLFPGDEARQAMLSQSKSDVLETVQEALGTSYRSDQLGGSNRSNKTDSGDGIGADGKVVSMSPGKLNNLISNQSVTKKRARALLSLSSADLQISHGSQGTGVSLTDSDNDDDDDSTPETSDDGL